MLTLTEQLAELRIQIDALVKASGGTLPEVYGVGPVVAATIIGHSPTRRHPHPAPLRHRQRNRTHPGLGRTVRHRLNRGGNRQLNRALYTIAITQIRADTEGRAYYQRNEPKARPAAKPSAASKRRLSDLIYRTLRNDLAGMVELPAPPRGRLKLAASSTLT